MKRKRKKQANKQTDKPDGQNIDINALTRNLCFLSRTSVKCAYVTDEVIYDVHQLFLRFQLMSAILDNSNELDAVLIQFGH